MWWFKTKIINFQKTWFSFIDISIYSCLFDCKNGRKHIAKLIPLHLSQVFAEIKQPLDRQRPFLLLSINHIIVVHQTWKKHEKHAFNFLWLILEDIDYVY